MQKFLNNIFQKTWNLDENDYFRKVGKRYSTIFCVYPLIFALPIIFFAPDIETLAGIQNLKIYFMKTIPLFEARYLDLAGLESEYSAQYFLCFLSFFILGPIDAVLLVRFLLSGYQKTKKYEQIGPRSINFLILNTCVIIAVVYVFFFRHMDFSGSPYLGNKVLFYGPQFVLLSLLSIYMFGLLVAAPVIFIRKITWQKGKFNASI